jgi:hypothetical protein
MVFMMRGGLYLGLALLLAPHGGCTVDRLTAAGRPCSIDAACGPNMICGPTGHCVPVGGRDAAADSPRRDGAADAVKIDRSGADGPLHDLKPTSDLKPPDLKLQPDLKPSPDSGPLTLVNESFTTGLGKLTPKQGTWTVSGGEAVQSSADENDNYATATVPVTDYTVESVVTVHSIKGIPTIYEGAGVAARVQPPLIANVPAAQYACVVLEDGDFLALAEGDGKGTFLKLMVQKATTIKLKTPYRVRLVVKGKDLTCSLPDNNLSVKASDSTLSWGVVGLTSLHAHASWSYLLVTSP